MSLVHPKLETSLRYFSTYMAEPPARLLMQRDSVVLSVI